MLCRRVITLPVHSYKQAKKITVSHSLAALGPVGVKGPQYLEHMIKNNRAHSFRFAASSFLGTQLILV